MHCGRISHESNCNISIDSGFCVLFDSASAVVEGESRGKCAMNPYEAAALLLLIVILLYVLWIVLPQRADPK